MGWITAIQPNGKICVLSTVTDGIIFDDLTDEEYIAECKEKYSADQMPCIIDELKSLREGEYNNFEQIKDSFYPDDENEIENIREWLKSVGDPDWDKYDYALPDNGWIVRNDMERPIEQVCKDVAKVTRKMREYRKVDSVMTHDKELIARLCEHLNVAHEPSRTLGKRLLDEIMKRY